MSADERISEVRTTRYCIHPFWGFVCSPDSVLDFAETISTPLGHEAVAHIDAWGFRNRPVPEEKPAGEIWIGLFGGSVAFSVASSSNETTIAGYLEAVLNRKSRRRVRVLNFALPAGQQPQQLLIFTLKSPLLDGAITFDGVNEVVIPAYYNRDAIPGGFPYRPIYETLFARRFSEEQIALQRVIEEIEREEKIEGRRWLGRLASRRRQRRLAELRDALQTTPPPDVTMRSVFPGHEPELDARIVAGAKTWMQSAETMHVIAKAKGIDMLSVLQPVPEQGKTLSGDERRHLESYADILAIRERGYRLIREHAAQMAGNGMAFLDFTEVFADRSASMYVDLIHFNDAGCRVTAERMAEHVSARWSCLAS